MYYLDIYLALIFIFLQLTGDVVQPKKTIVTEQSSYCKLTPALNYQNLTYPTRTFQFVLGLKLPR